MILIGQPISRGRLNMILIGQPVLRERLDVILIEQPVSNPHRLALIYV